MIIRNLTEDGLKQYGLTPSMFPKQGESEQMFDTLKKDLGDVAEVTRLFHLEQDRDGVVSPHNFDVCIHYKGSYLVPFRYWGEKSFILLFPRDEVDGKVDFRFSEPRPNKIGVFTKKKLDDWLNYLIRERDAKLSLYKQNQDKISAFLSSLGQFEDYVHWLGDSSGYIELNGIKFSFEFNRRTGYIDKRLSIDCCVPSSIEAFKALATNSYKSK